MRTTDALKIGMALGRIRGTLDAWEESKHPRRPDGKFGSGGGSSGSSGNSGSGKSAAESFISKWGLGMTAKDLVSKTYKELKQKGIESHILNDKYLVIEGKQYKFTKNKAQGKWNMKEF